MRKYFQVFKSNWQVDFEYRLNFFLGRLQNLLVLFTLYFLWTTVFRENQSVFGYTSDQILTYVIASHLVRNLVLNSRAKFVGEEITSGFISSVLTKPISYFGQSFSEDLARRVMNILTSLGEVLIFIWLVRPPLFFQTEPKFLFGFAVSLILAIFLHYVISFIAAVSSFWTEEHWGPSFLTEVTIVMLSGALFPLDALPDLVTRVLTWLPFYYIVFFPVSVFLGRVSPFDIGQGLVVMVVWLMAVWLIYRAIWRKGLQVYQAYGG